MTTRKKYAIATVIVVILLAAFLFYYFKMRNKKEKCPDGRDIPESGDCSENPVQKDATGNLIVPPAAVPDASGCVRPDKYITNHFPLTLGMKGDLVKKLQEGLNTQFNAKLVSDGFLGCNTLDAMKKAFDVDTMDAQFYKDKILTPLNLDLPILT